MEEERKPQKISRRKLIAGIAATAGVSAAVASVYGVTELVKSSDEPQTEPLLKSVYIGEPVPKDDPESQLWNRASAQKVALEGQAVIVPLKPEASVREAVVRSLHNGEDIAFLIEWEDAGVEEHTIKIDAFRDACAVFLGPHPADAALWMMGTAESPVTILHWKADWQKDIDSGFQDLEVAFPNASFDFYPPLVGVTSPKVPDDYPEEARDRLPGWSVGNPISQPVKTSPVEKVRAISPGTLEHLPTQNASGRGVWQGGKWRVVISKPMQAADEEEQTVSAGSTNSLAFAVWAGGAGDRGSRKSITKLGQLVVEAAG